MAADFLRHLAAALPYKVHTVPTDNGTHFTDPTGDGRTPEDIKAMRAQKLPAWCHAFEAAGADLDIQHRLTKPRHPWTNGQVERMNRTIKDATVIAGTKHLSIGVDGKAVLMRLTVVYRDDSVRREGRRLIKAMRFRQTSFMMGPPTPGAIAAPNSGAAFG